VDANTVRRLIEDFDGAAAEMGLDHETAWTLLETALREMPQREREWLLRNKEPGTVAASGPLDEDGDVRFPVTAEIHLLVSREDQRWCDGTDPRALVEVLGLSHGLTPHGDRRPEELASVRGAKIFCFEAEVRDDATLLALRESARVQRVEIIGRPEPPAPGFPVHVVVDVKVSEPTVNRFARWDARVLVDLIGVRGVEDRGEWPGKVISRAPGYDVFRFEAVVRDARALTNLRASDIVLRAETVVDEFPLLANVHVRLGQDDSSQYNGYIPEHLIASLGSPAGVTPHGGHGAAFVSEGTGYKEFRFEAEIRDDQALAALNGCPSVTKVRALIQRKGPALD
jgi:hypothetical protein